MVTPTGYTALDLVGFTDKGPYSALENYVKNDLAHYAGSIWRCKIDDTTNVTPAENANWTVFVSDRSDLVEASIAPIETSPATAAHAQGSQLFYNDTLYKAKTAIAIGDSLVVDTNIEAAPKVTTQLDAKANTADLGTAAAKNSTNAVTSESADLVTSGGVYASEQNIYEVMGQMGAKNLLPYPYKHTTKTLNGVTFTDNGDGSITVNTAGAEATTYFTLSNKDYGTYNWTLSGASEKEKKVGNYIISNGLSSFVEGLNIGYNATYTETTIFVLKDTVVDNITIYPMLRLASDTDSTYQPYAKSNQELTKETIDLLDNVNKLGAKNLLPLGTLSYVKSLDNNRVGTWNGNQYELYGVTYTLNTDDNDNIISISATGTATNRSNLYLSMNKRLDIEEGQYILSCYGEIINPWLEITLKDKTTGETTYLNTIDNQETVVNVKNAYINSIYISVGANVSVNGKTYYPMLRLASEIDKTYVLYAKSNKELTEDVKSLNLSFTYPSSITSDLALIKAIFIDCVAYLNSVGDCAFGSIMWTSHGYRGFQIEKVTSTGYKGIIHQENKIWTANYDSSNDTLSAYSYVGTAVT